MRSAIPRSALLAPGWEETVAAQLATITDLDPVLEGRRRAAALQKYVSAKTEKEAVRRIWLLTAKRIGELLGPAEVGHDLRGRFAVSPMSDTVSRQDRYRFRLLAAYWDIAKTLIGAGTLSQGRIIAEIERQLREAGETEVTWLYMEEDDDGEATAGK